MPLYDDHSPGKFDGTDPLEAARRHFERGRFAEAARELRSLIERDPSDSSAHAILALCLHRMGKAGDGDRTLGRALKISPRDPVVNAIAGHLCIESEQFDRAEEHLLNTLDTQPRDDESMRLLAVCHSCRGRYPEALEIAQRGLEMNPRNAGLWTVTGICQHGLGRTEEARRSLLTAVQLDDGEAEAHHALGIQDLEADRFDDAARSFRRALKANPSMGDSRKRLVWTRFFQQMRKDTERAEGSKFAILRAAIVGLAIIFLARGVYELIQGRPVRDAAIGLGLVLLPGIAYCVWRFIGARRKAKRELQRPG